MVDDLIEVLAERGYTTVFEPSLKGDKPIVLVTVRRGGASYVAMGPNSWKALQRAALQVPQSDGIFYAVG